MKFWQIEKSMTIANSERFCYLVTSAYRKLVVLRKIHYIQHFVFRHYVHQTSQKMLCLLYFIVPSKIFAPSTQINFNCHVFLNIFYHYFTWNENPPVQLIKTIMPKAAISWFLLIKPHQRSSTFEVGFKKQPEETKAIVTYGVTAK